MIKFLLFSLYFFTFSFFISIDQFNILISFSLFLCVLLLIVFSYKFIIQLNKIKIEKNEFVLIIFMAVYMIYTFIIGIVYGIENSSIYKVLINNAFVSLFIMLVIFHSHYKDTFVKIRDMLCYSAIFVGLIGILMFLINVCVIKFSGYFPFIDLIERERFNDLYGVAEYRYQYTFTHKVRFGYYCLIMIFLLIKNNRISSKVRNVGIFLMLTNVLIANSVTTLIIALILLYHYIRKVKINKYLKVLINIATVAFLCFGVFETFQYILQERNIFTLGNRLPIWEGIIGEIQKNPFGYVDAYYTHNFYYYKVPYIIGSAHNVFLAETFDYGIIGGIIFLAIYIQYFRCITNDRKILFLIITTLCLIDVVLGKEGFALFFLSYFVLAINDQQKKMPDTSTSNS